MRVICNGFEDFVNTLDIVDYNIDGNVTTVIFRDGTTERAVCDEKDAFDLEEAIKVCMHKKLMGKLYYNSVKIGMSCVKRIDAENKRLAEKEAIIERRRQKRLRKEERRKNARREEQISLIVEALKRYDSEK